MDKYDLELPWVNNFFRISTGVLEGQELWLKFSELLFPVYKIKNFDSLDIPFKCVATDISTGQAVVLDSGEIVSCRSCKHGHPFRFYCSGISGSTIGRWRYCSQFSC